MDNKWLWIGFGALVLVFILARQRGNAQVIGGGSDLDVADMERSRFDFAARGLESLTSFLSQEKEYERNLALGRMSLERDVLLGKYSLERDVAVAGAQERAASEQARAYLAGSLAQAATQAEIARNAQSGATKRSWIDGLFEFGSDLLPWLFGGNKSPGFSGGTPTFGQPVYRPMPIGQPTFGR